jgi:pyruvate dehydrogenase (quinone)
MFVPGGGARHPGDLHTEIVEAFAINGPAVVDCVAAADEMPNLPHFDLDKIGHYAIAKIKEAVIAVTDRNAPCSTGTAHSRNHQRD